jgi:hypothetical protein
MTRAQQSAQIPSGARRRLNGDLELLHGPHEAPIVQTQLPTRISRSDVSLLDAFFSTGSIPKSNAVIASKTKRREIYTCPTAMGVLVAHGPHLCPMRIRKYPIEWSRRDELDVNTFRSGKNSFPFDPKFLLERTGTEVMVWHIRLLKKGRSYFIVSRDYRHEPIEERGDVLR